MDSLENMATVSPQKKIIVVGGGWAGLSCAYALSQRGHRVTLLEAAPHCGGRARSVHWPALGIQIDNGQHILLGAYQNFLAILTEIGAEADILFNRHPFNFSVMGKNRTAHFTCKSRSFLPTKLSLIMDLYQAKGWTWAEKYQLCRFINTYIFGNTTIPNGLSVLDLLTQAGQSKPLIQYFWEPILVAALTTPLNTASAEYALKVLKDSFCGRSGSMDVLIPKVPLGEIFANPMTAWLKERGHSVLCHQRATSLIISDLGSTNAKCIGVKTKDNIFEGEVVLAMHPRAAVQTLSRPVAQLQTLHNQLSQFTYQPIITIYYAFPYIGSTDNIPAMQAIVQDNIHYWLFCRQVEHYTVFSAVFSGTGPHLFKDKDRLMDEVQLKIQAQYAILKPLIGRKQIQEKFACFSADAKSHALQPEYETALPGLWLCGDYSSGAYPATLEGAVQSGLLCAKAIDRPCKS